MSLINALTDEEIYGLFRGKNFKQCMKLLENAWDDKYGLIKLHPNNVVEFVTGGWSENEELIYYAKHLLNYDCSKHYVGSIRGGSHYFAPRNKDYQFKIIDTTNMDDVLTLMNDYNLTWKAVYNIILKEACK